MGGGRRSNNRQAETVHSWADPGGAKRFMAFPHVVLAEGDSASVMLYRYRCDGEFCGDTWHESLQEAQEQAQYEYGPALGNWSTVPRDAADASRYAITYARENRDSAH
jgi:hypothetical protein